MIRYSFILLIAFLGLSSVNAARLSLISQTNKESEIIVSRDANPVERYAAEELQRGLKLSTGVEFPITHHGTSGKAQIIIGTANTDQGVKPLGAQAPAPSNEHDQIAIHHTDHALYLTGSNPRSVLYATYRFLEEALGFCWFWPGDEGEYYRKQDELILNDFSVIESANIQYRYLAINAPHYDEPTLIWMARNRMNIFPGGSFVTREQEELVRKLGFLYRYAGHNLVLPNSLLTAHPEFIAEYGGQRALNLRDASNLCWSNPGVQDALVETIQGWINKHQAVDLWSFYPADNTHFCQCGACVAMAPDISTRFQKLSALLIKRLHMDRPELRFASLAYANYRDVPTEVAPFETIQYATYNVSFRHFLSSGHPSNQTAITDIRRWKELGVNVGIRAYDMIPFRRPLFVPNVSYMIDQISFMKKEELNSFSTEVTPYGHPRKEAVPAHQENWVTNRMNLYAVAQAMWTAEESTEKLVTRWTNALYGEKAAPPMNRYYHAIEKSWREAPGDLSYFLNPPEPLARGFITDSLISLAEQAFAEARQLAQQETDDTVRERATSQVALEEQMFDEWKALYVLLSENADRFRTVATPAPAAFSDLMNPNAPEWDAAPRMPAFTNKEAQSFDPTEVSMLWRDDTLYLRAICIEGQVGQRMARFKQHDENVWSDDSLELFVNSSDKGGYYHLAVNSLGVRYDAYSPGGMNLDLSANPEWEARSAPHEKGWATVIALPLKSFSLIGKADKELHFSIKRTRAGKTASGWPEASYHSPSSHGIVLFGQTNPRGVLLYRGDRPKIAAVESFFRKHGWRVGYLETDSDFQPELYDVVYLRYGVGKGFDLSSEFIRERLYPWVERGGTLIISASHPVPLVHWIGREDLSVRWSGWDIAPTRRTTELSEGEWLDHPNHLRPIVEKLLTPGSGFIPSSDDWESLASLPMKDGSNVAYLLRTKVDQGQIFLTSSNMGYGGGHEMFGNQNPENVVLLIENLHHSAQPH